MIIPGFFQNSFRKIPGLFQYYFRIIPCHKAGSYITTVNVFNKQVCLLLFTVPTEHKNRSMPYKERLPGGFHNWNLSSW